MKKILLFSCLLVGWLPTVNAQSFQRCGTSHLSAFNDQVEIQQTIHEWLAKNGVGQLNSRAVVTIPVVVHVVWSKQEENIPNEQILSQIAVLNQDFRKANVEIPGIPSLFQNLVADVEIEFCLAAKDPSGNATTGITRTFTNNSVGIGGTPSIHYTSQGGKNAWDTEHYLNIWVAKFAGGVGGIASFPGEGLPAEDGIEINYLQFGTLNTSAPYHLGRTCTHEIGHYLNLEHPWGPGILDCCKDDFVADTPAACETYLGQCPTHPVVSCAGPDMFMNYMFYTDDACMGMFSLGQKLRMLATLNTIRSGLLNSDACMPVSTKEEEEKTAVVVYQNPVVDELKFELKNTALLKWSFSLYDAIGKEWLSGNTAPNIVNEIPVQELPAGIYFLVLKNDQHHLTQKIAIN